jgi:Ankyrin repeat
VEIIITTPNITTLTPSNTVQCPSQSGRTPLHYTSEKGHIDIVRLLLDWGINIDAADKVSEEKGIEERREEKRGEKRRIEERRREERRREERRGE